jgi:hypothetical protein
MYLIGGNSLPPKKRESYVGERSPLRRSGGPVLALHHAKVSCRTTKRDSIAVVIGADSSEGAATGYSTFEMVNVRRVYVGASRLIVAAVLIEPRNWKRICAAVRGY